ncbi:hypothetical protein CSQ89_20060 [Chitinimonas sp. BJB300]|nr:hypothetical protein CSQ89_20060 [Chitinimonas sp. BJB300]
MPPMPPEAFTACEGKQDGDKVSFVSHRGDTITGRCKLMPARLVMVPDSPPRTEGKRSEAGANHQEP